MFSGPPLPLPHDFPLLQLAHLITSRNSVGAWLRGCNRELHLSVIAGGLCSQFLISGDLGRLLRCCSQIVVREGLEARVLESELLIRWRALQVVTGTHYLPGSERLREIFPRAQHTSTGFSVPIEGCAPEEVLACCLTHGIAVAESRIIYRALDT